MRAFRPLAASRLAAVAFAASLVAPDAAFATLRIQPLFLDLAASGPAAQGVVTLENDRPQQAALEVVATRRTINADGSETERPADGDFAVFPPQALIPPGGGQTFRVLYVGDPDLAETASYHLGFREVPVRFGGDAGGASLSLLLDLRVGVHVSPPGAEADLAVESVSASGSGLTFAVRNAGRRYAAIADHVLVVRDRHGAEIARVRGEALLDHSPSTIVPPRARRVFTLVVPNPSAADVAIVDAERP